MERASFVTSLSEAALSPFSCTAAISTIRPSVSLGRRTRLRIGSTALAMRNSATRSCQAGSWSDRSAYGRPTAISLGAARASLDIEARQEEQTQAAIPLHQKRLLV